jgi:hypothetical protein
MNSTRNNSIKTKSINAENDQLPLLALVTGSPSSFRSVCENQNDILAAILAMHCPEGFDADLTFGNGSFWKKHTRPRLCFDVTPLHEGVIQANSCALPCEAKSLQNVVFDPPFLTYVKNGRDHNSKVAMTARFGGYWTYGQLTEHYTGTLDECARVLRNGGKVVFKCQDVIHNHRMHCTHANVIQWGIERGFRLRDLFVLTAKSRMPGPQKGTQRHARVWHSYFLVLEKVSSFLTSKNL